MTATVSIVDSGAGQAPDANAVPCGCGQLLDALMAKVEDNYPGYTLEVLGMRDEAYRRHQAAMRRVADAAEPGIDCLEALQAYAAWFEDGHLFVGGRPRVATAGDSARLLETAPRVDASETDVVRYLERRPSSLDPIEGIWRDPAGLTVAVVRNDMIAPLAPGVARDSFVGFVLDSSVDGWKPGNVIAELTALPDGSYDAILYDDARAKTRPHVWKRGMQGGASLQREGLLLHMPPMTWGKLHPVRSGQEGRIDPLDPRAPTARLAGESAVVFHVPSHVPQHAARLNALVAQYRGALQRAETLIIDLRGNEGGSTFVTDVLLPFLITSEQRAARYLADGEAAVLVSADNIAFFERQSWAPQGLMERLKNAELGELVPFSDPDPEADARTEDARHAEQDRPRNVAILTDGMTVSAAEAFVLRAMRNGKVILFGQPTGGSIDYQTVGIVRFGCPEDGLYLGYPTIIGSDRLPEGGTRPTGIVPDVPIDAMDPDPISTIIRYFHRRSGTSRGAISGTDAQRPDRAGRAVANE